MPTDDERIPRSRRTVELRRMYLTLAAFLLVVGFIVFRFTVYDPTRWTYRFHQRDLTAIVARIKAQQIPIGKDRTFEVARSLDPETLAPYKEGDYDSICQIVVYRRDQDDYLISIAIDDEGHFGTYGLLYSDLPIKTGPVPGADVVSINDAPGLHYLKARLSSKWSYVFEDG